MSAMPRATATLVLLLLPAVTLSAECGSLADLRWLLGEWTAGGAETAFHESWTESTPQTFEGTGIAYAKPDGAVKSSEVLRLVEMAGGVFYIAKVAENELPIAFRLTVCDDGTFAFENPAHDFPRRLQYRRDGDERLQVTVSDGGPKGYTVEFHRADAASDAVAAVLAAEDVRFAAMMAAKPEDLRRRLAPDLAYAHSNGRVENREQLIDTIVSGRMRYLAVEPLEREASLAGESIAIVRGRGRFQVKAGETPLDLRLRYLAIYVLTDGNWLLRDWQSLREPD